MSENRWGDFFWLTLYTDSWLSVQLFSLCSSVQSSLYHRSGCCYADEDEKREAESFRRFLEQEKAKHRTAAATAGINNDDDDDNDMNLWW